MIAPINLADLVIDVTAEDIEEGQRQDCERCPVARATQRAAEARLGLDPQHVIARVDYEGIEIEIVAGGRFVAELPDEPSDWIDSFDHQQAVIPISFTMSFTAEEDEA